jgi:hypothetical protein
MVNIVVRFEREPLAMLEHGMAGLRLLSEQGQESSRVPQTRALAAGLLQTGAFLEVAEALSVWLVAQTADPMDDKLLALVRAARAKRA